MLRYGCQGAVLWCQAHLGHWMGEGRLEQRKGARGCIVGNEATRMHWRHIHIFRAHGEQLKMR